MYGEAWNLCTKWHGNKASYLAKQAVNLLQNFGYDIELKDIIHSGQTEIKDGTLKYTIGVKELAEKPYRRFPIHEALAPTVACFHEVFGHGGQWRNETKKDTSLSKVLLLNDLACKSSR